MLPPDGYCRYLAGKFQNTLAKKQPSATDYEVLRHERDALRHECDALRRQAIQSGERIAKLETDVEHLKVTRFEAKRECHSMKTSLSWRLTWPLRLLRDTITGLQQRIGALATRRRRATGSLCGHPTDSTFATAPIRVASGETKKELQVLQRSGLFDEQFYLESNPDVAAAKSLRRQAAARRGQKNLDYRPLLSVLIPTCNTLPIYLEAAVRSVIVQAYSNWELRIVDDGSSNVATLGTLERIASWDNRIFVARKAQNRGISATTNEALRDARGDYVAMLHHDDELTNDALYEVVRALNCEKTIDVIYTDQDYISPEGKLASRLLKPDWSPALFRGVMYVGHLLTVRRSLALDFGGFDSAFDSVHDYEFMLRVSERTQHIHHVPMVLCHSRRIPESVAGGSKANQNIEGRQADAVQAHLRTPIAHRACQIESATAPSGDYRS